MSDRPVIIIDAPELNDEAVANVRAFLCEILLAFESHYLHRLQKYHRLSIHSPMFNKSIEDKDAS